MTRTLRVGTFTRSVLLDLALRTPGEALAGWSVQEVPVASSPAQFASLTAGEIDLAVTNPDNVLLYGGLEANPLGRRLDLEVSTALDRGLDLSLWARPGLDGPPRVLGVDVPVSGFAFVAFALLERLGVARHGLEIVSLGATPRRREALAAGACDVTVLGSGNELRAATDGATRLADAADLGPYVGAVACRLALTEPGSDPARAAASDAVAAAMSAVARELSAGERTDAAVEAAARLLGLDATQARAHVDVLCDPRTGAIPDGTLSPVAIALTVDLRVAAGATPRGEAEAAARRAFATVTR